MGKFYDSIPIDFKSNRNTDRFAMVLDLMHLEKVTELDRFEGLFNPVINYSLPFLRKLINEYSGWNVPEGMPKSVLENILYKIEDIFEFRSTLAGMRLMIETVSCGSVLLDFQDFQPTGDFIVPSDTDLGYLPTDTDYFNLLPGGNGDFLYLYEEDLSSLQGKVRIEIASPFSGNKEFRDFIEVLVTDFIPFYTDDTLDVHINHRDFILLKDTNSKKLNYGYYETV